MQSVHRTNENVFIRINIFDHTSPYIKLTKRPIELAGIVIKKVYYQIRDISTNEIVVPFDNNLSDEAEAFKAAFEIPLENNKPKVSKEVKPKVEPTPTSEIT